MAKLSLPNVIFPETVPLATELPSTNAVVEFAEEGVLEVSALNNAGTVLFRVYVALFRVLFTAKVPLGLTGAIFRFDDDELLEVKEMTSSIAQSGIRSWADSFACRGMKRRRRQFKFVGTLPRS